MGDTPWIQAFATISCSYTVLGLISLPSLFFFKWNFREFRATMPYGLAWFSSMLTLFFCFYVVFVLTFMWFYAKMMTN